MENCIFCKIIKWLIPANKVYEDDEYVAFHDINPKSKTHILIIPKNHIESFHMVEDEEEKKIVKWLMDVSWKIIEKNWIKWCNLLMNSWKDHWQEVFHIHLHLLSNL